MARALHANYRCHPSGGRSNQLATLHCCWHQKSRQRRTPGGLRLPSAASEMPTQLNGPRLSYFAQRYLILSSLLLSRYESRVTHLLQRQARRRTPVPPVGHLLLLGSRVKTPTDRILTLERIRRTGIS